jgi:hypothetical protein
MRSLVVARSAVDRCLLHGLFFLIHNQPPFVRPSLAAYDFTDPRVAVTGSHNEWGDLSNDELTAIRAVFRDQSAELLETPEGRALPLSAFFGTADHLNQISHSAAVARALAQVATIGQPLRRNRIRDKHQTPASWRGQQRCAHALKLTARDSIWRGARRCA